MADSNRSGTFILSDVRQRSLDGYWETALTNAQYGWFLGGEIAAVFSSASQRLDFSNDTATAITRGVLSVAKSSHDTTGNANYGWSGGGMNSVPTYISNVDRTTFSSDLVTAVARGPLSGVRSAAAGADNNLTYGWYIGGVNSPGTFLSTVDRITFSTDTATATARGNLPLAKNMIAGTSNQNFNWHGGGNSAITTLSIIDRIDFSNDLASASTRSKFTVDRYRHSATGNLNFGWFVGGFRETFVERIDYSNDLVIAIRRGNLSTNRDYYPGATSNSDYGWFAGGSGTSSIERIDFSNDLFTPSLRGPLTGVTLAPGSKSGINNYPQYPGNVSTTSAYSSVIGFAWIAGGTTAAPAMISSIERIDFANDNSATSSRGSTSQARAQQSAVGNSIYGWNVGGNISVSSSSSVVDRADYSNDLNIASARTFLGTAAANHGPIGTSNYGWFAGFQIAPAAGDGTTVIRMDYSNDTAPLVPRGFLPTARYGFVASFSNGIFGWTGGGSGALSGNVTTVDRLDLSNDLVTALARGPLTVARSGFSQGVNNLDYGWFAGGWITPAVISTVERVDFSSDMASASVRGPLPTVSWAHSAAGNNLYGWFMGGNNATPAITSIVYRIDYGNDSAAASTRGPLSIAKTASKANSTYINTLATIPNTFGRGNYGFMIGGNNAANNEISSVIRVSFSNDTAAASIKGSLSNTRAPASTTGNDRYGWTIAGQTSFSPNSNISRTEYSTDSTFSQSRQNSTIAKHSHGVASNNNFGWAFGGVDPGTSSSVIRMSFSNDAAALLTRGTLTSVRYRCGSLSSLGFGYTAAGAAGGPPYLSSVDRTDFSNDSAVALARSPLTIGRTLMMSGGVSNTAYGWFAGGYTAATQYSTVDRIDFSSDLTTGPARGNLSAGRFGIQASGNDNFGYFLGGGYPGGGMTYSDRIQYSNDTAAASRIMILGSSGTTSRGGGVSNYVKGMSPTAVSSFNIGTASVGTSGAGTYGWLIAGYNVSAVTAIVSRINFSNDSVAASNRGSLITAKQVGAASGNQSYAWYSGGVAAPTYSTVERIDYSNDGATAVTRGTLPVVSRYNHTALGTANFGWHAGGPNPASTGIMISTIDRIDYSNDNIVAISRGLLSTARRNAAGVSNGRNGWFGGGYFDGTIMLSSVNRADFSNDTTILQIRGPLVVGRFILTGVGNSDYGWFASGFSGSGVGTIHSNVERINYTNDSVSVLARSPLSVARFGSGGVSNPFYGWIGSGATSNSPAVDGSTIDRIDFSNDLITALVRGSDSLSRKFAAGTSNYVR